MSVVMPVRNEESAIEACLASLLAQDYPADRFEIVVLDGSSTDRTPELVRALAAREPRVRLIPNPGLIVSTAINLGFDHVRGELVARADGHSTYAPDYLRAAVRALSGSGADVVGGPMVAAPGGTACQRAVARALASRFGMGGAAFHFDGRSGPAEAVYLGVFRADALNRFGDFDEQLVRDEDDEWFARARKRGARVWLDSKIRTTYTPRASLDRLFRQYFEYGLYKPAALRRVPGSWRVRHAVPSLLVAALVLPALAGFPLPTLAASVVYLAANFAASAHALRRDARLGPIELLQQSVVFAAMHVGYGLGFLAGLVRRLPDGSLATIRKTYTAYARHPARRRAWSETDPGQRALLRERDQALADALRDHFTTLPTPLRVLDLGSGGSDLAGALAREGIADAEVIALDLLRERLGRRGARIAADARRLPFHAGAFDVVLQCTMLSSIPAEASRRRVAHEMRRVVRAGGLLLSYDARLPNPLNRHVRRISRADHRTLFPDCEIRFRGLTLLPPLARRFPRLAPWLVRWPGLRAFDLAAAAPRLTAPSGENRP